VSGRSISRFVLDCDGCQTEFGRNGEFDNPLECRGAAYAAGWRFPGRLKLDGTPARNAVSDVCPACVDGWEARPV
jgi:hypothetical protein